MRQKSVPARAPAEQVVKDIRRATRRHFSAEDKIRIVLEGLRGEDSIAELCRREGIVQNLYYRWSKDFLEAGKKRLAGDTARAATSDEVKDLRREASALKEVVAELTLENRAAQKKHDRGWGRRGMRYPASEKLEIIRLVEQSHLPVRRTLDKIGIPRPTFYRWYDLYRCGGPGALEDRSSRPGSGLEPHPGRGPSARSSTWRWRNRTCRPGSWPCASPTRKSTLCRRRRSIGCSRPMI